MLQTLAQHVHVDIWWYRHQGIWLKKKKYWKTVAAAKTVWNVKKTCFSSVAGSFTLKPSQKLSNTKVSIPGEHKAVWRTWPNSLTSQLSSFDGPGAISSNLNIKQQNIDHCYLNIEWNFPLSEQTPRPSVVTYSSYHIIHDEHSVHDARRKKGSRIDARKQRVFTTFTSCPLLSNHSPIKSFRRQRSAHKSGKLWLWHKDETEFNESVW